MSLVYSKSFTEPFFVANSTTAMQKAIMRILVMLSIKNCPAAASYDSICVKSVGALADDGDQ